MGKVQKFSDVVVNVLMVKLEEKPGLAQMTMTEKALHDLFGEEPGEECVDSERGLYVVYGSRGKPPLSNLNINYEGGYTRSLQGHYFFVRRDSERGGEPEDLLFGDVQRLLAAIGKGK